MPSPFDRQPNDLAVVAIEPSSQTDPRVPLAPEFALGAKINTYLFRDAKKISKGWISRPTITVVSAKKFNLSGGSVSSPSYPGDLKINSLEIEIPSLSSGSSTVKQVEKLSLVTFVAEVGASEDQLLGKVSFQYRQQSDNQILTVEKENARRLRAFWVVVLSSIDLTKEVFLNQLLIQNATRKITINNILSSGFVQGDIRIYANGDLALLDKATYKIEEDLTEVIPILNINRLQNFLENGYVWGNNGEEGLDPQYSFSFVGDQQFGKRSDAELKQRVLDICTGIPGKGRIYKKAVQNLASGSVPSNPGYPGEAASSPNGSVCLGSDQRIHYFNQEVIQTLSVQEIVCGNDGNDSALAVTTITNLPSGSYFSPNKLDHKIYAATGDEISQYGRFLNLGGIGSLTWIGEGTSLATPGSKIYFVPGIKIPAGSGFSYPFKEITKGWRGDTGALISSANILKGQFDDLIAYQEPVNNELFFVVTCQARAGILYIYKKIKATSNDNKVLTIPVGERGCFAFVEGIDGRVDTPVLSVPLANQEYNTLVYYPPKPSESWQFLLNYPEYQGSGDVDFLQGSQVTSFPFLFLHCQGGGNSFFVGDSKLIYSPVAMYLPRVNTSKNYLLNNPIQLEGEPYQEITFREITPLPGSDVVLPSPGQTINVESSTINHAFSLEGKLSVGGYSLGFKLPRLNNEKWNYQAVLAFSITKNNISKIVIATCSTIDNASPQVKLDTDNGVAIGLFDF